MIILTWATPIWGTPLTPAATCTFGQFPRQLRNLLLLALSVPTSERWFGKKQKAFGTSDPRPDNYSDIDLLSGTYADVLFGILSDILSWHSIWHLLWHFILPLSQQKKCLHSIWVRESFCCWWFRSSYSETQLMPWFFIPPSLLLIRTWHVPFMESRFSIRTPPSLVFLSHPLDPLVI